METLVAAFWSSAGMLSFHVRFCESITCSQSARGISNCKSHFWSLITNQRSILAGKL